MICTCVSLRKVTWHPWQNLLDSPSPSISPFLWEFPLRGALTRQPTEAVKKEGGYEAAEQDGDHKVHSLPPAMVKGPPARFV